MSRSRRRRRGLTGVLLMLTAGVALCTLAWAAAGALDPTFDTDGKVTTDFGSGDDVARALTIQPGGKLVAAGVAFNGADNDFALARYTSNGSLDTSFGTGGKVRTNFSSGSDDRAFGVAIQPNGKIVAAGQTTNASGTHFALVRYNGNGTPDLAFGDGFGRVTTQFAAIPDDSQAFAVLVLGNGKIVAAGRAFNGANDDFALARYNTNGFLDTTFGGTGKVMTNFVGFDDSANALVEQNGHIVAAGVARSGSGSGDFALVRYNTNGSLDPSFGIAGRALTDFGPGTDNQASGLALGNANRLVAAGKTSNAGGTNFALARYNVNGGLDTSFGAGGKVTTDFGGSDFAQGVAVRAGKTVAAGTTTTNGLVFTIALARYNMNGTLDAGFGTGGKVTTNFTAQPFDSTLAYAVVIQPDKKPVIAGKALSGGEVSDFALARYKGQ